MIWQDEEHRFHGIYQTLRVPPAGAKKLVTPNDVKAMKIQMGNVVASYPEGDLAFYGEYWGLPLTSAQTALMKGTVIAQVGYLIDTTWQHTDIEEFPVGDTLPSLLEVPNA